MFKYKAFICNPVQENCYILWDDDAHDGAIIDCGAWNDSERQEIASYINKEEIHLKYSLQTHCHFDHIWGLSFVHDMYNLVPKCHAQDINIYNDSNLMVEKWFRTTLPENMPELDPCLKDGTVIPLESMNIQVIHTPGHTPGGVCFYVPEARLLFSGDTIFRMGVGRTDLQGGSYQNLMESINNKLFLLPDDTVILPGHGPSTTIGDEKNVLEMY